MVWCVFQQFKILLSESTEGLNFLNLYPVGSSACQNGYIELIELNKNKHKDNNFFREIFSFLNYLECFNEMHYFLLPHTEQLN